MTFPRRYKIFPSQLEASEDLCKWVTFTLKECQQRIGNELSTFYMLGNKSLNGPEHQKGHQGLPRHIGSVSEEISTCFSCRAVGALKGTSAESTGIDAPSQQVGAVHGAKNGD